MFQRFSPRRIEYNSSDVCDLRSKLINSNQSFKFVIEMEFRFNVNDVFKQPIVEINSTLIPPGFSGDRRALW